MAADREQRIQQRAYEIWEREGRPQGRERENWHQAEEEIAAEERGGDRAPRNGRVGRQKAEAASRGAPLQGTGEPADEPSASMKHVPKTGVVGRQKAKAAGATSPSDAERTSGRRGARKTT